MKKIIAISIFLISTVSFSQTIDLNSAQQTIAQNVVDMANSHNINWNRKNGQYYLKDVNNFMIPYLGTWS